MARQPSERARFEVLLEELRGGFRTVAEGHSLLVARMDRFEQRMDGLEQRMDRQFAVVIQRIGFVEAAILEFGQRFTVHEQLQTGRILNASRFCLTGSSRVVYRSTAVHNSEGLQA